MRKYILIVLTLFTFLTLVSACTEDIVIPNPEDPSGPVNPIPPDSTGGEDPWDPTPIPPDSVDIEDPYNPIPPDTTIVDPTDPTNPTDPIPGNGTVPGTMVGNWVQGTFSMTEFWNYDGSYAGNASEQSNVFIFGPNGECEQYFMMTQRMYNCTTSTYTYRKGTVVFDEANGTFTFTPASGNMRGFYSCAPSSNINRPYEAHELVPTTYYYHMEEINGVTNMVTKFNPTDSYGSYFKKTIW